MGRFRGGKTRGYLSNFLDSLISHKKTQCNFGYGKEKNQTPKTNST